MTTLRWTMRGVGTLLIGITLAIAVYARFGGEEVGDGLRVQAGRTYYLVASGAVAHCDVAGQPVDIPPLGPRELLDGARVEPRTDGNLTCRGGDVAVTSGPALLAYPIAEYDFLPVIIGAALIVIPRFLRPSGSRRARQDRA